MRQTFRAFCTVARAKKAPTTTTQFLISSPTNPRASPPDVTSHHPKPGTKEFTNPWPSFNRSGNFWTFFKARFFTNELTHPTVPENFPELIGTLTPSWETGDKSKIKAVWLGHACFYVELPCEQGQERGLRILFDPSLSLRCSPFTFAGPERITTAAASVDKLPELDVVCFSHNHYDHLDITTLKALNERFGGSVHYFVPLGVSSFFNAFLAALSTQKKSAKMTPIFCPPLKKFFFSQKSIFSFNLMIHLTSKMIFNDVESHTWGIPIFQKLSSHPISGACHRERLNDLKISNVTELDWWQEKIIKKNDWEARLSFLPAQHFTGRSLWDTAHTLWGSFSIESTAHPEKNVWFAGDTGRRSIPKDLEMRLPESKPEIDKLPVCPAHKQIGDLRGPFAFGMLPIGAYKPRYFMSPVHTDPEEAVEIYKEAKIKTAAAMHWGAWVLSSEETMEPKNELERLCKEQGIEDFQTWKIGERREI